MTLSRFQFASTSIFQGFFFVSLTVGMAFLIAVMETFASRAGNKGGIYDKMTGFSSHLFLINFAVGVVTGIVQEVQFGMSWRRLLQVRRLLGVSLAGSLRIARPTAPVDALESALVSVGLDGPAPHGRTARVDR